MTNQSPASTGPRESLLLTRPGLAGLFMLFFCSGAVALIYEVIWQRQFALVFGGAAPATAAVLAAYFAGLSLGSLALGSVAKRWARPLRAYAVLEALIAIGALLVRPLLTALEKLHPLLFEQWSEHRSLLALAKAALAFVALAWPTFCMGGTLPVLARLVDAGQRKLGRNVGLLYVANTAGAALGALCVPFVLLPLLGTSGSTWFCAAGNASLAATAWQLEARRARDARATPVFGEAHHRCAVLWKSVVPWLAFVSGVTTFVLQILWNRAFAQVHENSVYSFAVLVSVFILALAVGGQLARFALRRRMTPSAIVGWAWVLAGVSATIAPWLFLELTDGMRYLSAEGSWSRYGFRLIGVALAVLVAPVTFLGMGLPAILERAGQHSGGDPGALLGQVLATNLIGSVVGAVVAGFLMPKWVGLWSGLLLTAALLILVGGWLVASEKPRSVQLVLRLAFAGAYCASLWPILKMDLPRARIAQSEGERLIALSEGTYGIVAVTERSRSRRLKLNNYYVLGGTASAGDERMQAHVPLMLHSWPRRVAVLGLGTAITASGALFHPVEQIRAVELVPEVIAAARTHFADANAGVLDDPRTRVITEDARSYLRGTSDRFDVIIGDLVVPWRPGEGALFTREHFVAAQHALAPGGVFCQWLPLFQLSEPELQIILRTFLDVFPRASVWRGDFSPNEPAIALVGGVEPFALNPSEIRRRIRENKSDPLNPHATEPIAFWMHFVGVLHSDDLNEQRINREDRPWIELLGPMQHGGQRQEALCVGRKYQAWIGAVKQRTQARWPELAEAEKLGVEAGDLMLEFTLLTAEGNQAEANAVQERLRRRLPETVFKKIFP